MKIGSGSLISPEESALLEELIQGNAGGNE